MKWPDVESYCIEVLKNTYHGKIGECFREKDIHKRVDKIQKIFKEFVEETERRVKIIKDDLLPYRIANQVLMPLVQYYGKEEFIEGYLRK